MDANSDIIRTVLVDAFQMRKCVLPAKRRMLPVSVFLLLGLAPQVKRETLLVYAFLQVMAVVRQVKQRMLLGYVYLKMEQL